VYYSNPRFKIQKEISWHLLHSAAYLLLLWLFYTIKSDDLTLSYTLIIIMLCQSAAYIVSAYFKISKHQKNVLLFSSNTGGDLSWLKRIIIGIALILFVVIVHSIFFTFESLSLWVNAFITVIVFDIAYHSIKQKEIFPFSEAAKEDILALEEEAESEEQKKKIVSDEELILLRNQLDQFMNKEKPYLDPELNLVKLAGLFDTTPHRLSYVINSGFDKNFFNFINQYRVSEAKLLLANPKMEQFSLLGIAYEAGFSSKTSFNNAFKKMTGLTPSDFKKSGSTL
jgi:AraC-like DNA-binding protein